MWTFMHLWGSGWHPTSVLFSVPRRTSKEERKEGNTCTKLGVPGSVVVLSHVISLESEEHPPSALTLHLLVIPLLGVAMIVPFLGSDWPAAAFLLLLSLSGISPQHDCGFLEMWDFIQTSLRRRKISMWAGLLLRTLQITETRTAFTSEINPIYAYY